MLFVCTNEEYWLKKARKYVYRTNSHISLAWRKSFNDQEGFNGLGEFDAGSEALDLAWEWCFGRGTGPDLEVPLDCPDCVVSRWLDSEYIGPYYIIRRNEG